MEPMQPLIELWIGKSLLPATQRHAQPQQTLGQQAQQGQPQQPLQQQQAQMLLQQQQLPLQQQQVQQVHFQPQQQMPPPQLPQFGQAGPPGQAPSGN